MKYDLIVIGGGSAGLMAAKTAAEDGLKVVLIERRRNITANRDSSMFYFNFLAPEGYIEPVTVELGTGTHMSESGRVKPKTKFSFLVPGFSVEYTGPIQLYYNYINISPAGYQVYALKDELWGFNFSKEVMLADLLASAEKTGVEVLTQTMALGVENTKDGVKVLVRTKSGEKTMEARRAIVADGNNSKMVESLGLNKNRQLVGQFKGVSYIFEGMEVGDNIPDHCSYLGFTIPSLSPVGIIMNLYSAGGINMRQLLTDKEEALQRFMKHTRYAPWFRHTRLMRKTTMNIVQRAPALKEPAVGNVLITGAALEGEGGVIGSIVSGYQSAKATLKELNSQKGYPEYKAWFHNAYASFTCPEHDKLRIFHYTLRAILSDDEVDYIYSLLQGKVKHALFVIRENPELVKDERPELYQKVKKTIEDVFK